MLLYHLDVLPTSSNLQNVARQIEWLRVLADAIDS
jgi:hypothetical protein